MVLAVITSSDVNKATSLKTKTTIGKTNTKNRTNVIAANYVIFFGKVAMIVSFYSAIFCMF